MQDPAVLSWSLGLWTPGRELSGFSVDFAHNREGIHRHLVIHEFCFIFGAYGGLSANFDNCRDNIYVQMLQAYIETRNADCF